MFPLPDQVSLPYMVSDHFREREALAGRFIPREQRHEINVVALGDSQCEDLAEIYAQLALPADEPYPIVLGTGVGFPDRERTVVTPQLMLDAVHRLVGSHPVLLEPAQDLEPLVEAYRDWIRRWRQAAQRALVDWVRDDASVESARPTDSRVVSVPILDPEAAENEAWLFDARDGLEEFVRARAARIRLDLLRDIVDDESLRYGIDIVGERVWKLPHTTHGDVLASYEDRVARIEQIALRHHYLHADTEQAFVGRMQVWASRFGSERLRIGLADGYRMTAAYLQERLASEAPGFHAFRARRLDLIGKERTAPSEEALRLRRAVQAWLDENASGDHYSYDAVIRWVDDSDIPAQLTDQEAYEDERNAEAIVIAGWLGRYQLVGMVDGPERPDWVARTLSPADYGLVPPSPAASASASDDDIPF